MARATRSSNNPDKIPSKHLESKKRKRISEADEPAPKLLRADSTPYAATSPIDPDNAHKILHVLQMIDSQGLLDRVYPLEQSSSSANTYSLRTLLTNSQEHTLATLRTAVQSLLPISIHPRAPTHSTAAQQQRFCDLALSLLEQASFHPISLDVESLLPQEGEDGETNPVATSSKRYALMQHLPGGDYWTSANLQLPSTTETGPADLKDLLTGHADLVAIFPTPSVSTDTFTLPKLGDYSRLTPGTQKKWKTPLPGRRVSRGSFLDYGPWSSFAPSWTQDGTEIGMHQMGEVYAQKAKRYRDKLQARQRAIELAQNTVVEEPKKPPSPTESTEPDLEALRDILLPEEIESLKSVLDSLELENAVQELLERNRKALQRLGHLQVERLRSEGGRTSTVKEGDEEWDVAQGILDSLALLASLRPRSSAHSTAPLRPPPAVLHTLMQTLPRSAVPGWHGTLPASTGAATTALRDDATVKVRPGVPATAPAPAPVATPAPIPASTYPAYSGYYAPQAAAAAGGQQLRYPRAQQQGSGQQYYPQQTYAGATQMPYGYSATSGWYGAYGNVQTAGTSGATPTPSYVAPSVGAGSKAVANTVLGKAAVGGAWTPNAGTQTPPVLPAHLRTAAGGPLPTAS
ncbi:hypothetical protein GGX14DRAFT_512553 [Mycena pura]|uniref:Uncharacterized protein n=1 Tax=Mycena pura TaxID=153505 RepID=A0AAD6YQ79_9AGAR|nr:hypothetical protein GGX14DRAFT_512553 [Mycena pura]